MLIVFNGFPKCKISKALISQTAWYIYIFFTFVHMQRHSW